MYTDIPEEVTEVNPIDDHTAEQNTEDPITVSEFDEMVATGCDINGWKLIRNCQTNIVIEKRTKRWRIWENWDGIRCNFLGDFTSPPIQIHNSYAFKRLWDEATSRGRNGITEWFDTFDVEGGYAWRWRHHIRTGSITWECTQQPKPVKLTPSEYEAACDSRFVDPMEDESRYGSETRLDY